ncbi:MAG: energy-coupling factor ABC transporter ATP-binding protein [Rhodoferax sp.]|nr:energy-coupling factor ABC transporter ATP-binding protein [Rhodoferax sp.]MCF8207920.1 energy-coupling factor ABC transporter ATP-binding protein [Rhodoferax sp.]
MSVPAVALQSLHYAYPDGQPALSDVNLQLAHGEAVAIVGGNGAGKSTLLLHLNGVLRPGSGTVLIDGQPITKDTLAQVRRTVGLVFQDSNDQLFMPTVAEDVAFGPLNLGLPRDQVDARVSAALQRVGALHLALRPPYRLSGGEKRAVAIAGVLAMEPSVLVMDEPSEGLDPAARRTLIDLLAGLQHTRIIATHDLALVLDLCTRVVVLCAGRIEADGPPAAVFSDASLLARCRLESPHIAGR